MEHLKRWYLCLAKYLWRDSWGSADLPDWSTKTAPNSRFSAFKDSVSSECSCLFLASTNNIQAADSVGSYKGMEITSSFTARDSEEKRNIGRDTTRRRLAHRETIWFGQVYRHTLGWQRKKNPALWFTHIHSVHYQLIRFWSKEIIN